MFGAHRFYLGETGTGAAIPCVTLASALLMAVINGFVTIFISLFRVFIDLFLIPGIARRKNSELAMRLNMPAAVL